MVLGFNHNIMYKGETFHVQTEDSGVAIPHIITLLYRGGVILCSKKTSYSDILMMDNLEVVVEELMKEQHKDMMRRLKSGEFDERAFPGTVTSARATDEAAPMPPHLQETGTSAARATDSKAAAPVTPAAASARQGRSRKGSISLDDAILAFFAANEK